MRLPVIPINRTVCVACAADLAELGELECSKCLFESRFAAWAKTDCELPLGVAMPIEDALRWASGGTMPPRICEVAAASVPREVAAVPVPRQVASRRVSQTWVGLLLLTACALGWMFARFA